MNDVFQIDHAAWLYETLYPVAAHRRRTRDDCMNDAVEDFKREVRQSVFDRMSVSHVVSDRFESDPGWPVKCAGETGTAASSSFKRTPGDCRVRTSFLPRSSSAWTIGSIAGQLRFGRSAPVCPDGS